MLGYCHLSPPTPYFQNHIECSSARGFTLVVYIAIGTRYHLANDLPGIIMHTVDEASTGLVLCSSRPKHKPRLGP